MYNVFQFEKKENEEKMKMYNQKKEEYLKNKKKGKFTHHYHLVLNEKLFKNYNNRLNNFIFDMAYEPVVIKDYTQPVNNPRKELFHEEENRIIGNHGLILNKYQTVKDRIVNKSLIQ